MKKNLSFILAVIMVLSCLATLALGVSAEGMIYPNGNTQMLYNSTLEEVGYHRIIDSFYRDQNCFKMKGLIRVYSGYDADVERMFALWDYKVTYSSGDPMEDDDGIPFTELNDFVYIDQQLATDANRVVEEILIVHTVTQALNLVTSSTLTAKYSIN